MNRLIFFSLLIMCITNHSFSQSYTTYEVDRKEAVHLKKPVIRKLTKNAWVEYKRVYNIKGRSKAYSYEAVQRSIKFEANGDYWQGMHRGKWSAKLNNLIVVEIGGDSVKKPMEESITEAYYIEKINRRELVLVKGLDPSFSDKIVYFYRKSSNLDLGFGKLSTEELRKKIQVDMAVKGIQPPVSIETMDKMELINLAMDFYFSNN